MRGLDSGQTLLTKLSDHRFMQLDVRSSAAAARRRRSPHGRRRGTCGVEDPASIRFRGRVQLCTKDAAHVDHPKAKRRKCHDSAEAF